MSTDLGVAKVKENSQIDNSLSSVDSALNQTVKLLESLADKLGPVLGSATPPRTAEEKNQVTASSPVASRVGVLRDRIEGMNIEIENLIDRLET